MWCCPFPMSGLRRCQAKMAAGVHLSHRVEPSLSVSELRSPLSLFSCGHFPWSGSVLSRSSRLASPVGSAASGSTQHIFLKTSSHQVPRVEFRWPGLGRVSMPALTTRARRVQCPCALPQRPGMSGVGLGSASSKQKGHFA